MGAIDVFLLDKRKIDGSHYAPVAAVDLRQLYRADVWNYAHDVQIVEAA
jgi:hypothetical protein